MEHTVQPQPGSHVNKLWKRTMVDRDSEPLYSPLQIAARSSTPMFVLRNNQVKYDLRLILTFFFFSMFDWNENCTHFTRHSISACAQVFIFFLKGRNNCYILASISKNCVADSWGGQRPSVQILWEYDDMCTSPRVQRQTSSSPHPARDLQHSDDIHRKGEETCWRQAKNIFQNFIQSC